MKDIKKKCNIGTFTITINTKWIYWIDNDESNIN